MTGFPRAWPPQPRRPTEWAAPSGRPAGSPVPERASVKSRSRRRPVYHDPPPRFGPIPLWSVSRRLYRSGFFRLAKAMKAVSFLLFRAILPPEAVVGWKVRLEHYGLGMVIHPNTVIGDRCRIYHGVTLGSSVSIGSEDRIIIGSDVLIGTGARVMNRSG